MALTAMSRAVITALAKLAESYRLVPILLKRDDYYISNSIHSNAVNTKQTEYDNT